MARQPAPNKQPDLVGLEPDGLTAPVVDAVAPAPPATPAEAAPPPPAAPASPPAEAPIAKADKPAAKPPAAKPAAKPAAAKPAAAKAPVAKPAAKPSPAAKAPKVAARAAPAATVKAAPAKPVAKPVAKAPTAKPAAPARAAEPKKPEAKKPDLKKPEAKAASPSASIARIADVAKQATKLSPQFREMAERNVDQAKKAYEQYVGTTERMLNTLEDAARQAWSGTRDVNLRMLGFADANAKAGFDYAERLVRVRDVKELASLQKEYLQEATERLGQQMQEIQQMASQAARDAIKATNPKS